MRAMESNERISPEIQVIIAAALARYLRDDKLAFKVVSIKLIQTSQINLWGLEGRLENMVGTSNRRL